jgi:hypothetical protein
LTDKTTTEPATQADILAFFDKLPAQSMRAWVLKRNDEVLGVAGFYVSNGVAVVFSDSTDGIPKLRIWRESLKFMRDLKIPAICTTQGSGPFLERLGWIYVGPSSDGDVYRFEPVRNDNE